MLKCSNVKMKNGFTLVEFLTVIAIIGILTAITIPNYQSAKKKLALQRSAYKLAQDIRRAQEMAMSARKLPGGVPKGGYGIYFELGSGAPNYDYTAKIYADTSSPNERRNPGGGEDIENISLENEVYIYVFSESFNKVSINFKPPDPIIKIKYQLDGNELEMSEVSITLCIKGTVCSGQNIKKIKVNKVGLIELINVI